MTHKRKLSFLLLLVFIIGSIASLPLTASAAVADTDDASANTFKVTMNSNLFGTNVKTYDASTKHITVVYEINMAKYAIVNADLELSYDKNVFTYNTTENKDSEICPVAGSLLVVTTPATPVYGEEGLVKGNFGDVNNRIKAYGKDGKPAVFFKVVLDVNDGAAADTTITFNLKTFRICEETKLPENDSISVAKKSQILISDEEVAKFNAKEYSEATTLPGDGEPGKFTVKVTSNLFGEDVKTYDTSETKHIAVVYELNYPGYAIYNSEFELTYDPKVLTFNKEANTTASICPAAASYVQLTTPADTTFGTEGSVSGLFSEVNNRVKAYGANNKPATFLKVIFDVADTAQGVTVVNLDVKRMKLCDETKIDQEFTAVKDSKVELSDTELAKLNVNDYSMKVDLSAHVHTVVIDKAVAATCTKTGLTEGSHCSVCNEVIKKQEVVPALGHQVVVDKAVAATCTKTGLTEGSHCSRCNTVIKKQEVVKALGHNVVIDKAVAPTCTEVGYTEGSHCSRCGEVIKKQEVIPSKGHTPVIDEAVDATCQHTGLTTGLHCSTCGAVLIKQEVIPKLQHKIVYDKGKTATCTETGLTEGSHCSLCNEVFREQTVIPALGHNYQVVKGYPATKTETGLTDGIRCSRCGEWLKKQEVIPKLGTEVLIGDVNMDGVVNGADAGILARHTSGWKNYDRLIKNWEAADVNRDGKVNGADAGILARYTSGWTDYNKYIKTIVL